MNGARGKWFGLAFDTLALAVESQVVVGLRLAKFAAGDTAALAEANLMVAEKAQAVLELQARGVMALMTGSPGVSARGAVAHYRRKVRANRRRLTAGR
jgi:hypothetical protein